MAAVAHGWRPPKSSGVKIPVKVAKEFNAVDTRASHGGAMDMGKNRSRMMSKIAQRRERMLMR